MTNLELQKAMEELGVLDSASPATKLRAACQWFLGDPSWASTFIGWAQAAGYEIAEHGRLKQEDE